MICRQKNFLRGNTFFQRFLEEKKKTQTQTQFPIKASHYTTTPHTTTRAQHPTYFNRKQADKQANKQTVSVYSKQHEFQVVVNASQTTYNCSHSAYAHTTTDEQHMQYIAYKYICTLNTENTALHLQLIVWQYFHLHCI